MVPVPLSELLHVVAGYEQAKRWPEADRLLRRMLDVAPHQPETLHLAGIVAFRMGRPVEALERMEQAIRHGIDTPLYLRNVSEVYRTLGRLDSSLNVDRIDLARTFTNEFSRKAKERFRA